MVDQCIAVKLMLDIIYLHFFRRFTPTLHLYTSENILDKDFFLKYLNTTYY